MIEYKENRIWWENFFFDLKYQEDYVLKSVKIDWYQKFSYSIYLWIWMISNWYLLNSSLENMKKKYWKKYFSDSPKNSIMKNNRSRIWWFFFFNRYQNIVYLISRVSYNDHVFSYIWFWIIFWSFFMRRTFLLRYCESSDFLFEMMKVYHSSNKFYDYLDHLENLYYFIL